MIYLYDFKVFRKKKSKLFSKYLFYRKKYFKQSFSGTSMVECEDVTYTTTGRFIIFKCKKVLPFIVIPRNIVCYYFVWGSDNNKN